MNDDDNKKKLDTENYFKEALCADSAEVLLGQGDDFNIKGVIKINASDSRGTFYLAMVEPTIN